MTLNSGLYSGFALSDVVMGTCKNLSPSPREQAGGDSEGFGPRQRVELAVVFPTVGEIPQISSRCLSRCKKMSRQQPASFNCWFYLQAFAGFLTSVGSPAVLFTSALAT